MRQNRQDSAQQHARIRETASWQAPGSLTAAQRCSSIGATQSAAVAPTRRRRRRGAGSRLPDEKDRQRQDSASKVAR